MTDPVTIESGRTFERANIETYFNIQRERQQKAIDDDDSDKEDARFFVCPITQQPVDPEVMIPNVQMKRATDAFLDKNPWAFEFDPRTQYPSIHIID